MHELVYLAYKEVHCMQTVKNVDFAALSDNLPPFVKGSYNSFCNYPVTCIQAASASNTTQEVHDTPDDVMCPYGRGGSRLGNFRIVKIPSVRWIIDALREGQPVQVREALYVAEKI